MSERFPAEEMAARLSRVRAAMDDAGLDACVVLWPESQLWLAWLACFISGVLPQALVVPVLEQRAPVLVMWDADVPLARATSVVEEIRAYRFGVDDPVAAFRSALEAAAPGARIVGFDAASRAVPHALGV